MGRGFHAFLQEVFLRYSKEEAARRVGSLDRAQRGKMILATTYFAAKARP